MEKSINLLIEDLGNPIHTISYSYGRPYILIENENVIDTWSLTNSSNGDVSYYIDEILYTYKLHREIKQRPIDLLSDKIKI